MSGWGGKEDAAASGGAPCPSSRALEKGRSLLGGVLCVAVACLLLAPAAFAAAPANDRFSEAEDLGSSVAILIQRSNVDATKEEPGEPFLFSSAGHSVWFKWEAPNDEPVTIDTCDSEFPVNLYLFTGPDLDALVEAGRDSNIDGRFCEDAGGITFRPASGTVYWVFVDGNGFHFPGAPTPPTEGSFKLKVEKTPSPGNDDFADRIVLHGSEGGEMYSASADGFNWNATDEVGEPDHAGDPGGASIWFEWTAPRSGSVQLSACKSLDFLLGLYTGNSANALASVAVESRPASCFINFFAIAGTTYQIAVDGKLDTGTGFPKMGSPGIRVTMKLPQQLSAAGGSDPQQPSDTKPPNTAISRRMLKHAPGIWIFTFRSNEPGSTFQCKLDRRPFKKCPSSKRVRRLAAGKHVLKARAIDSSGNVDQSPAVSRFTVKMSERRRARR